MNTSSTYGHHNWIIRQPTSNISAGAKICYIFLAEYTCQYGSPETASCSIKVADIGRNIGCSYRTAQRYTAELIDLKLLKQEVAETTGVNIYTLLAHEWIS